MSREETQDMVKPVQLGHVNIRVRDVERSEKFYTEVLGLEVTHRRGDTVFLSAREHSHELAIRGIGPDAPEPDSRQVGTNHFAWEMASFEDLQTMYRHLKEKGVKILGRGARPCRNANEVCQSW